MIRQHFNAIYKPVFTTPARYIHIHGGRSRGGSHFGTDYFLHLITQPHYFRGYFLREVFNDIRGSLWQDFKDRIEDNDTISIDDFQINENEMKATYLPTGNTITSKGFKKSSGKSTAKLKSIAGATHVLIEEAEEIDELDFNQLDVSLRTTKNDRIQVCMIFNPPNKDHWIIRRWYNLFPAEDTGYYLYSAKNDPNLCSIYSTYKDNLKNVNETTATILEGYKDTNPDYYYTMVKGLVSEGRKGVIFRDWKPITLQEYNELPYAESYGLDFGFSADPTAIPGMKIHNNKLYLRQLLYESGLTTPMLNKRMKDVGLTRASQLTADSAEPKTIADLRTLGWNIEAAVKGPDSVLWGIRLLQSMEVYYVESCKDLVFEKDNYRWALDAEKNPTDRPEDKHNHLMDAIRYRLSKIHRPAPSIRYTRR